METLDLKLSGVGGNATGCLPANQLDLTKCQEIADTVGEEIHSSAWAWAPKGCHFITQHDSMWLNTRPTNSTGNTNYTSVCKRNVPSAPESSDYCGENTGWDSEYRTCLPVQSRALNEASFRNQAWTFKKQSVQCKRITLAPGWNGRNGIFDILCRRRITDAELNSRLIHGVATDWVTYRWP